MSETNFTTADDEQFFKVSIEGTTEEIDELMQLLCGIEGARLLSRTTIDEDGAYVQKF